MPSTVLSLKKHGSGQQVGKVSFSYVLRMSVVHVGSFYDVPRQQKRGRPAKIFTFLKDVRAKIFHSIDFFKIFTAFR